MQTIITLLEIMLSLSPTTAKVERGFSVMNLIKTKQRTQLRQYDVPFKEVMGLLARARSRVIPGLVVAKQK